jgi:hypothetical protein
MNQIRTIFVILFLVILGLPQSLPAGLGRPLKDNEIKALKANVVKDPTNVRSRLFLAHHYYGKEDWFNTAKYLGPIAEKLGDSDIYKLSQSYLKLRRARDSEGLVNILLSDDKVKSRHFLLAAKIYSEIIDSYETPAKKKPYIESLFSTLKRAKEAHPQSIAIYDSWLEMAEIYLPHYSHDALRIFEDMKTNKVRFEPRHYSMLCKINYLAGYTDGTKTACTEAMKKDPQNPSNYIYLGQNHVNQGEEKKGKRMLASVGKKFSSSEEALWAAADSYYQSKDISQAYNFFKQASQHPDAQARDYLGLAKTAFELNKYGEALNAFVRHCEVSQHLHQEFRRASGLLKKEQKWQERYRQKMLDCKPTSYDKN